MGFTHTHKLTHSYTHPHSHTLSLTHNHSHTHSHSHNTHTLTQLTHTITQLTHTHTQTHTHTHSHTYSHTHTHKDVQNIVYDRIPTTSAATELKKEGMIKWQRLWEGTEKGALCRSFFPTVEQRLKVKLPITPEFTAMVTGHGKTVLPAPLQINGEPDVPL